MTSTSTCLCGSVKITSDAINPNFTVCHCETCRTWGGGPFLAIQCGANVVIEGQDHVSEYASSAWASRGFCLKCGTHLFYKDKKSDAYNLPIGTFAELPNVNMDMQYFSDARPDYYCFSNETKHMTRLQIEEYLSSLE